MLLRIKRGPMLTIVLAAIISCVSSYNDYNCDQSTCSIIHATNVTNYRDACSDSKCAESVCSYDDWCCKINWDNTCTHYACADPNCACEYGECFKHKEDCDCCELHDDCTWCDCDQCNQCHLYSVSLEFIEDNSKIKECKDPMDCDCDGKMTELIVKYIGEDDVYEIAFYDEKNAQGKQYESCIFNNISNGNEMTCTSFPNPKFKSTTTFAITYNESMILDECVGSFHTSCSQSILGNTQCDGDLKVIGWTDEKGGYCYYPNVTESDSTSSSSSSLNHNQDSNREKKYCIEYDNDTVSSQSGSGSWSGSRSGSRSGSGSSSDEYGQTYYDGCNRRRRRRRNLLSSSSDSQESSDNVILRRGDELSLDNVCLNYVIDFVNNSKCYQNLTSIFLPLCSDTVNQSKMTIDDLNAKIVSIEPSQYLSVSAQFGSTNNETIGILVGIEENTSVNINNFEVCLSDVKVKIGPKKSPLKEISLYEIDFANYVEFSQSFKCVNNDGLPCLDIEFNSEPCPPINYDCDCEGKMTSVSVVYVGSTSANTITFSGQNNNIAYSLCNFESVENGEELLCTSFPDSERFDARISFQIVYDDDSIEDCNGEIHTSCSVNIVNTYSEKCNDLYIIGWTDFGGHTCYDSDLNIAQLSDQSIKERNVYADGHEHTVLNDITSSSVLFWSLLAGIGLFVLFMIVGAVWICCKYRSNESALLFSKLQTDIDE